MPSNPSTTKPKAPKAATTKPSKAATAKASATAKATQAKAEQAAPSKPSVFVPESFEAGEAPKGFVRYARVLRGNGHAVAEYAIGRATTPDEQALCADLATAMGCTVADLGAFVVVDWSGGTIASGFGTHALAYAYTMGIGGRTDLARAVVASVGESGLADLQARGLAVVPRPTVEQVPADA